MLLSSVLLLSSAADGTAWEARCLGPLPRFLDLPLSFFPSPCRHGGPSTDRTHSTGSHLGPLEHCDMHIDTMIRQVTHTQQTQYTQLPCSPVCLEHLQVAPPHDPRLFQPRHPVERDQRAKTALVETHEISTTRPSSRIHDLVSFRHQVNPLPLLRPLWATLTAFGCDQPMHQAC
ncbi:uncharacterized protein VDAG_09555 [Verticillium dahliae VdLs.17]|uniref:Secreted protein n=1 Tax=Verticillium dahliae (strain VdLs.17 / ATCC MYA-4575 / FGSC 10137) TaxID=498257 RepID=G2XHC3_VERDV|nr:uncharacterized protein VDAG_09555 [Verticillium dahliae VdLs.17]EGY19221.1 hypothetical protein VDAG_09555 [Verticillium dahliae VdLs.17]KAH6688784.1 hypothetical protein EV126DRAFT_123068 [Verticillium dahliae]